MILDRPQLNSDTLDERPTRFRFGVLVPSSNTVMEPAINHLVTLINSTSKIHVTIHYSRFRVTQISLEDSASRQFDLDKMMDAASLLADAEVDAIIWGGTSAGWLGIDRDRRLSELIQQRFHIPATTTTLALIDLLQSVPEQNRQLGLVTPYIQQMNDAIRSNFAHHGVPVVDDRGLSITNNMAISKVSNEQLKQMVEEILHANPALTYITVFCTNLSVVQESYEWEREYSEKQLVLLDSVSVTVWGLLKVMNLDICSLEIPETAGKIFTMP